MLRTTISMLLLTLAATSASAAGLTVDAPLPEGAKAVDVAFDADARSGAAWAVVRYVVDDPVNDSGTRTEEARVAIPGLSYDREARAVRLDEDGRSVVFAKRIRFLFSTFYRETPGCRLRLGEPEAASAARVVLETDESPRVAMSGNGR